MSSPKYCYAPLSSESQTIRLVRLLPGSSHEIPSCQLQTVSLNTSPVYEALSYVWGDAKVTRNILLEGCEFQVTTNLWAALRRLRNLNEPRMLWIDAICVDQENLDERSQQVLLMRFVYEQAQIVILWMGDREEFQESIYIPWSDLEANGNGWEMILALGSEHDDVLSAFVLLYMHSSASHLNELGSFELNDDSEPVIAPSFKEGYQALRKFLELPYWHRIWIVQEVVFAKSATIFWCHVSVPWSLFLGAANRLAEHEICCIDSRYQFFLATDNIGTIALDLEDYRNSRSSKQNDRNLLTTLWYWASHAATDPRDKVFSILELVTAWPGDAQIARLYANYSLTLTETLQETTLFILESSQELTVLYGNRSPQKFPSWMINLADHSFLDVACQRLIINLSSHFAASNKKAPTAERDNSKLLLRGIYVDVITSVTDVLGEFVDGYATVTCEAALKLAGVTGNLAGSYRRSGETWQQAFSRTITFDSTYLLGAKNKRTWRRSVPSDFRAGQDMSSTKGLQGSWSADLPQSYFSKIYSIVHRYKLFVTQTGFLGLGLRETMVGDEVFVLNGGSLPFVLRREQIRNSTPTKDQSEESSDEGPQGDKSDDEGENSKLTFRLIGECYVHGIMDGEACNGDYGEEIDIVLV